MTIQKEQIFLVSGRETAIGSIKNIIVCASSDTAVRDFLQRVQPSFVVLAVQSLISIEDTARKIKNVCMQKDSSWPVLVDPKIQ